jgi:hypothetical protein
VFTLSYKELEKMYLRFSKLPVLAALIGALLTIPAAPALAQGGNNPNRNRLDVPVTGVVQSVGTFAGTVAISRFDIQNQALVAIGQLTGTVTDSNGVVVRTIVTNVVMPVSKAPSAAACSDEASAMQTCDILNLVLGPLHLDLLGLVIDLNQVVLDITAQAGAGNLLGNLLCAITGLFDAGSIGQQLVNLLNQLIGVLAGL